VEAGKSILARRLRTILLDITLAEVTKTADIPRTNGRTALVTSRQFGGGLCDSIAMSTGNGIH
jgi:hypothetical protein